MVTVESANSIVLSPEWVSLSSQTCEKWAQRLVHEIRLSDAHQ